MNPREDDVSGLDFTHSADIISVSGTAPVELLLDKDLGEPGEVFV